ncbi:hypothetical protein Tco_0109574 [Tanacetum coccineum]
MCRFRYPTTYVSCVCSWYAPSCSHRTPDNNGVDDCNCGENLLAEGNEGALHLGPERPRVYSDLSPKDKERYNADIWATNILLQGLPKDIYSLINHYIDAKGYMGQCKDAPGRFVTAVKLNRGLRDSNYDQLYAYLKQHETHANEKQNDVGTIHSTQCVSPTDNLIEKLTDTLALLTQSYKTYLPQTNNQLRTSSNPRNQVTVQEGRVVVKQGGLRCYTAKLRRLGVAMDEEQLLFLAGGQDNVVDEDVDEQPIQDLALNVDNVFQADNCDVFDSDVDEAPTAQTMFMANLSSADPVYDEASTSYDLDVLSEYVKDNTVPVVQNNISSVPNDAYMMILNDMYESSAQCVSVTSQNNVVDNSLSAELATYKEQVELYERRVRFELTEREQKIDGTIKNSYHN